MNTNTLRETHTIQKLNNSIKALILIKVTISIDLRNLNNSTMILKKVTYKKYKI